MLPSLSYTVVSQEISVGSDDERASEQPVIQATDSSSNTIKLVTCPVLPPNFALTPQWIERLFTIASTKESSLTIGICGTCMLQALEMACSLNHFQHQAPAAYTPGVLFKNFHGDIIAELQRLEPELCARINSKARVVNALGRFHDAWLGQRNLMYNPEKNIEFLSLNMQGVMKPILGQHQLTAELVHSVRPSKGRAFSKPLLSSVLKAEDISSVFSHLMAKPAGTLWLMLIQGGKISQDNQHTSFGHISLVISLSDGLRICETNIHGWRKEQYQSMLGIIFDNHDTLFQWITFIGRANIQQKTVYSIDFYEIKRINIVHLNPN